MARQVSLSMGPFIYLLSELRRRPIDTEVQHAWQQIEASYNHHPEFLIQRSSLHDSIAALAGRAWGVHVAELAFRRRVPPATIPLPEFIRVLQMRKVEDSKM